MKIRSMQCCIKHLRRLKSKRAKKVFNENLLILYNPYYNQEMIEDHIRILNASENPNDAK